MSCCGLLLHSPCHCPVPSCPPCKQLLMGVGAGCWVAGAFIIPLLLLSALVIVGSCKGFWILMLHGGVWQSRVICLSPVGLKSEMIGHHPDPVSHQSETVRSWPSSRGAQDPIHIILFFWQQNLLFEHSIFNGM